MRRNLHLPAMPRTPALPAVLALFVLLALPVLLGACSGESGALSEGSTHAEGAQSVAPAAAPRPDLSKLDPVARDQIEERQRWQERLAARTDVEARLRAEAAGELGNLYQAYLLFDAARAAYGEARRLAPGDFRWPYYLGHVAWRENRIEAALEAFEAARRLAPGDLPTQVRLGEVLSDQNRAEEAEARFAAALALDPACVPALAGTAQIASARGDHRRAAELLEQALAADPRATSLAYPLALAYRGLGQTEKAEAWVAKRGDGGVRLKDPLMQRLHDLTVALQGFLQAGVRAQAAGAHAEAAQALRGAIAADPLFTVPRLYLAASLVQLGEPAAARGQLEAVLGIDPDHARANAQLASLHAAAGERGEAAEGYRRSLEAQPENRPARQSLARVLSEEGELTEALAEYRRLVESDPLDGASRLAEARILMTAQRYAEARRRLHEGLEALPDDAALAHALARLLATAPDTAVRDGAQALRLAEAVLRDVPRPVHAETYAMALAETGSFEKAVEVQERLLEDARAAGAAAYASMLAANLELYHQGRPCRAPWAAGGGGTR